MPNYKMTEEELCAFIQESMNESECSDQEREEFAKALIEVLKINLSDEENIKLNSKLTSQLLWNQQIQESSQLLIHQHYIVVSDFILEIIKALAKMGGSLVASSATLPPVQKTLVCMNFALVIREIIVYLRKQKMKREEACLYLQVRTHNLHKDFTINDLYDLLPSGAQHECNMHINGWKCPYDKEDCCNIISEHKSDIINIIESLEERGIVTSGRSTNGKRYAFS